MTFNIISTGSKGNAVVLDGRIMVDCGIPFKLLEPHIKHLRLVLLTHEHGDHFVPSTVRRLHQDRPTLRWGCCAWMVPHLLESGVDMRVIDVYVPNHTYLYPGDIQIRPELLTHNVPNCGYHIFDSWTRMFYATDTGTMAGILAPGYDWYFIEANHTQEDIASRAAAKQASGEYAYEIKAAENHLSLEQAEDWLYQNMGPKSQYVFLHGHDERGETDAQ